MMAFKVVLYGFLPVVQALSSVHVSTTAGIVRGAIDAATPNVVHFLGIPYAEPPVGIRRWLPAIPVVTRCGYIDATRFGPACPQFEGNQGTTWTLDAPEFKITPRDYMAEDCLSVNLWVPWTGDETRSTTQTKLLPVIAWIHGGSFQTGGASIPYQNPTRWVERSKSHIVVGIK